MRRLRKVAVNLLIIAFLYSTLQGMLLVWRIPGATLLPRHPIIHNWFYIYGVFLSVQRETKNFRALGTTSRLDEPPSAPRDDMIDIEIRRYFPQHRGEANHRMNLSGYWRDAERRERAWNDMAEQIRREHNEAHPNARVEQVFIYLEQWPLSPEGYFARYDERHVKLVGHD